MKNMILIAVLLIVTFLAIYLLDVKEPYSFGNVNHVSVAKNESLIEIQVSTKNINQRYFYDYEMKDDSLYVRTYKVVNPKAKVIIESTFNVKIDKGSDDFQALYINVDSGDKLLWQREEKSF